MIVSKQYLKSKDYNDFLFFFFEIYTLLRYMFHKKILLIFFIELPNRVSNIKFSGVTSSSVNISWSENVTKKEDYNYIIDCIGCYKRNIFPVETNQTYVILKNLDSSSLYYITVAIHNSVTVLTAKWPSESGTFQTLNKGK